MRVSGSAYIDLAMLKGLVYNENQQQSVSLSTAHSPFVSVCVCTDMRIFRCRIHACGSACALFYYGIRKFIHHTQLVRLMYAVLYDVGDGPCYKYT